MIRYRIVRMYLSNKSRRVLERGLTLEQVQAHCADPETSSSTCTTTAGKRRTRKHGPWFDGYEEDK